MNLNPLSLALVNPRGRFNAQDLWNPDQAGFYGDPSRAYTLFTTNPGTTNVTAAGDPIGRWERLAGSFNWTQGTSGARPVWSRMPKNGLFNLFTTATDTFTTRNFTTSAVQYTLSFRGTGTITLSGTSTAGPLVGTGANDRVSLTFTPTAGTLTLTVSGSVLDGQIVFGAVARDYQSVASAADVTQVGQPSVWLPYHNGSAWFDSGVQSFGSASLFADAGQAWTTVSIFRTLVASGVLLGKASGGITTNHTYQLFVDAGTSRTAVRLRGTNAVAPTVTATDGNLHLAITRWTGSAGEGFIDAENSFALGVGAAAQQATNITVGARDAASASVFFTGRLLNFVLPYAISNAQVDQVRAGAKNTYGVPL